MNRLSRMIGVQFGCSSDNVIITAGADEALDRICRLFLSDQTEVVITSPTFEMIKHYAVLSNAQIKEIEWFDNDFPSENIARNVTENTSLIILVSPNNPTGRTIPIEAIEQLAIRYPSITMVIDLAYVEFASYDPTIRLLAFRNIIVVRSFSKAWGLPGLRIGYALGERRTIDAMKAAGGPYSVAQPSIEFIVNNYEAMRPLMREYSHRIANERAELERLLRKLEIRYLPSESNFILLLPQKPLVFDNALRSFGIATRAFEKLQQARRLTLPGNGEAFRKLAYALREAVLAMKNNIIPIH